MSQLAFASHVIVENVAYLGLVHPADLDSDGDLDVLSTSGTRIVWHENTDGTGSFGPQKVVNTDTPGARSVFAADIDGDGDMDVLSATSGDDDDKITWYENTDGRGTFGPPQVINQEYDEGTLIWTLHAADLDSDGSMDALVAWWDAGPTTISWYENLSGQVAAGDANRDFRFVQQDIVEVLQAAKYRTGVPATWEEG